MQKYSHLFSPLRINEKYTFKNRIVCAPMAFGLLALDPEAAEKSFRKLESAARGGDACVTVGEIDVNFRDAVRIPLPKTDFTDLSGHAVERVGEYARRIKKHGAIALAELCHPGAEKMPFGPDEETIGPNDELRTNGVHVRAMNVEDMERIADDFVQCCRFLKAAGFDGTLIHGGHGFLFTQFLSPSYNKRTDAYGGSLENRARFPKYLLQRIRDAMGPDFIIELRITGDDGHEGGVTPEDTGMFVHMLEGIVDAVQISAGLYYDAIVTHQFSSMYVPHGCNRSISKAVKQFTKLPVGLVGGINDPGLMEELIENGEADYIVLGRQSLADPELANKAMSGREDTIRRCLRCFKCFPGSPEEGYRDLPFNSAELSRHVGACTVNPLANLPFDPDTLPIAEKSKRVLVIGGGPAGMEAALRACDRGHRVVLAEKSGTLGGMLFFTDTDPDKRDLKNFRDLLIREVKSRDIELRLNTEADAAVIAELKPEHIIIATGAEPVTPSIPGIENAYQSLEVCRGNVSPGKRVVMVGGGLVGAEQGLSLAKAGHEVTVISKRSRVADEAYGMYREALALEMEKARMVLLENTVCTEIGKEYVKVRSSDGREREIECDTVLYALGLYPTPTEALVEAAGSIPYTVIGSAVKPGRVDQATRSAYFAAINI